MYWCYVLVPGMSRTIVPDSVLVVEMCSVKAEKLYWNTEYYGAALHVLVGVHIDIPGTVLVYIYIYA
jgi:hypothetical protein